MKITNKSILLFLFFMCTLAQAQDIKNKPSWVKGMYENGNYFKICKNFKNYWKNHYLPESNEEGESDPKVNPETKFEEKEEETEKDPRGFFTKIFQSKKRAKEKSNRLSLDYKYFGTWKFEVEPYVKSDGSISSKEEQIQAWEQANKLKQQ